MEKNKTGKYFKYAIGEVVLVVIGILIALQINIWNENRKMQIIKSSYEFSLIEDLKKDAFELKRTIIDSEIALKNLLAINEKISGQGFNIDSIINIYRVEYSPLILNASSNFNRNTIEGLLTTGHINLFEKDLYNSLMRINASQKRVVKAIDTELGFYMNFSTKINLPFADDFNAIHGEPLETIWKNIDTDQFLLDFNLVLSSKVLVYRFNLDSRRELLKETESVLKILNN